MEVIITSKYIPEYGSSETWDSIDVYIEDAEKALYERIVNIKEDTLTDTKIVDDIKNVINNTSLFKKLYPSLTLDKVEQIIDTHNCDILRILPYLLTAYTYNYGMNKIFKKQIKNNYNDDDLWNGYRALFDNTYIVPNDSITNYKNLKENLARRFIFNKYIQHNTEKLRNYDNTLQNDFSLEKTFYDRMKILYIFSKYVQYTINIQGVDIVFSSYILQYHTLAFSVIQSIPALLWEKDSLDVLFDYNNENIDNTKNSIYKTLCQLSNIIITEKDIIKNDITYLNETIDDILFDNKIDSCNDTNSSSENQYVLDIFKFIMSDESDT